MEETSACSLLAATSYRKQSPSNVVHARSGHATQKQLGSTIVVLNMGGRSSSTSSAFAGRHFHETENGSPTTNLEVD